MLRIGPPLVAAAGAEEEEQPEENVFAVPSLPSHDAALTVEQAAESYGPSSHTYDARLGVISMPNPKFPEPLPAEASEQDRETYRRELLLARRKLVLEERLDGVYRFVSGVAHDLGAGYTPEQFWKGEASGKGAIHMLLHNAEASWNDAVQSVMSKKAGSSSGSSSTATTLTDKSTTLLSGQPGTQVSSDVAAEAVAELSRIKNLRDQLDRIIPDTPGRDQKLYDDVLRKLINEDAAARGKPQLNSSAFTSAAAAADMTAKRNPKEALAVLIRNAQLNGKPLTETDLRAYAMYEYNDGRYFPPNGTPSYTPKDMVELALKLAQLERFFQIDGDSGDASGTGDALLTLRDEAIHHVFLDHSMSKGIEDALNVVHNVCRKSHIPVIDLMTHARVRAQFSKLVASVMNAVNEINPRRPLTALAMRLSAREYNRLVEFFRHVDYASDGLLCNEREYDASSEQLRLTLEKRRAEHTNRTGTYYTDATRPTQGGGVPARIGSALQNARRYLEHGHFGNGSSSSIATVTTLSSLAHEAKRQADQASDEAEVAAYRRRQRERASSATSRGDALQVVFASEE